MTAKCPGEFKLVFDNDVAEEEAKASFDSFLASMRMAFVRGQEEYGASSIFDSAGLGDNLKQRFYDIHRKYVRAKAIMHDGREGGSRKLEDTLVDLAVYAAIAFIAFKQDSEPKLVKRR